MPTANAETLCCSEDTEWRFLFLFLGHRTTLVNHAFPMPLLGFEMVCPDPLKINRYKDPCSGSAQKYLSRSVEDSFWLDPAQATPI